MITKPFLLHALSPLHAGTGAAADVIDLPIARMKATGIPLVPGSSIKGVLRDAHNPEKDRHDPEQNKFWATFGPESADAGDHAGAIVVGDARLLALPVRSFCGTFAWVTSPLLLRLAERDLAWNLPIPEPAGQAALVSNGAVIEHNGKLYLQDIDLSAQSSSEVEAWASKITPFASPGDDIFSKRFAVVDDETMTFLWETATQVDSRIRIDPETGTVAKGALWQEESLPPETLLIGLMFADRARRNGGKLNGWAGQPQDVMDFALNGETTLQFGGKASTGRGRCRIVPINGGANATPDA